MRSHLRLRYTGQLERVMCLGLFPFLCFSGIIFVCFLLTLTIFPPLLLFKDMRETRLLDSIGDIPY